MTKTQESSDLPKESLLLLLKGTVLPVLILMSTAIMRLFLMERRFTLLQAQKGLLPKAPPSKLIKGLNLN